MKLSNKYFENYFGWLVMWIYQWTNVNSKNIKFREVKGVDFLLVENLEKLPSREL